MSHLQGGYNMSEIISQKLSENVGMLCLDNNFDKIESSALYVLTDVMKEYALEIAKEIKANSEVGGRS